ncbi:hypothetical protein L0Z31_20140 (plasmid) [Burkholderia vietnamiensis]|nr:hypothetical protein [Burkholderia vietnamiensis]MCO1349773.1 hypothetical protein [Burkholderia vietnamiensis]MCO1432243.1 hypothetical protein [Burkholderia vietnamiensis]UQN47587.1 hypothetical protein L0Y95_04775 [Burkholderia vietnamiensis]
MYEPGAGAVCLVLMAARHWREESTASVLATPLFEPLQQLAQPELRYLESRARLNWKDGLQGRLPDSWVASIADVALLPFAVPEIGRAVVPDEWSAAFFGEAEDDRHDMLSLFAELITHRNFYSPSKRAALICSGRVLEVVVTSLIRDVTAADIERILNSAPYHSAVKVASTKAAQIAEDDAGAAAFDSDDAATLASEEHSNLHAVGQSDGGMYRDGEIAELITEIKAWREAVKARRFVLSPWLIYCALNKTFNQVPLFTRPLRSGEQPRKEALSDVFSSGLTAFHAFWAAIASFEKGPIFDLPLELSNVNVLSRSGNFRRNNLFTQNILPLLKHEDGTIRGEEVISITHALDTHPLRERLEECVERAKVIEAERIPLEDEQDGRIYFMRMLGMSTSRTRITVPAVAKALTDLARTPRGAASHGKKLLRQISGRFPDLPALATLNSAIELIEGAKSGTR